MNIVKFTQSNVSCNSLTIVYDSKLMTKIVNFKFICMLIDKHLSWRSNKLLSKLSTVNYTIRKLSSVLNIVVLTVVYFANFKSFLDYGIILGEVLLLLVIYFCFQKE